METSGANVGELSQQRFPAERLEEEISSRLPENARAEGKPKLAIIMGPICAGKTTLRRRKYASGHVLVDAAQLFIDLGGMDLDFPSTLEESMEHIGSEVARRAMAGGMNIVTEAVGSRYDPVAELVDAMTAVGYEVEIVFVNLDLPSCIEREKGRAQDNVSSYYAEPYQLKWLLDAARIRLQ